MKKHHKFRNKGGYSYLKNTHYIAFHRFGQVQFIDDGLLLGSSPFSVLPQLPPKLMLRLKEVKIVFKK